MSRFYKTSQSNPIDWAYELPYQELMQGLKTKQMAQDTASNYAGELQSKAESIKYLKQDETAAKEQLNWLNSGVDSLVNSDLTDPTNRAKLRDFSREVAKRWGNNGVVGNIQASYNAKQAYLQELASNKNISKEQLYAAAKYWDNAYQGVGDNTPYGGTYNTFQGQSPSDFVDVSTEWMKLAKDVQNDKVTKGGSSPARMYIRDWETYDSLPNEDRLNMVWEGFLQREDVQNYIADGINYGYVNGMELDTIKKGGIAQIGTEHKETSKLRNDSWKNTQAGWEREDSELDLYTQLYNQVHSTGYAGLENTPVEAIYPNKTIPAGNTGYMSMSPQLDEKITKMAKDNNLPLDLIIAYMNQQTAPNYNSQQQAKAVFTAMTKGAYAPYMNSISMQTLKNIKEEIGEEFTYLPPLSFEGEGLTTVNNVEKMFTVSGQPYNKVTVTIKPDTNGQYGGRTKKDLEHTQSLELQKGTFNEDGSFTTQVVTPYNFDIQKQNIYNKERGRTPKVGDQNNLKNQVVTNQYADMQDRLKERFMDEILNPSIYNKDNPKRVIVDYSSGKPLYQMVDASSRETWEKDEFNQKIIQKLNMPTDTSYKLDTSNYDNSDYSYKYNK